MVKEKRSETNWDKCAKVLYKWFLEDKFLGEIQSKSLRSLFSESLFYKFLGRIYFKSFLLVIPFYFLLLNQFLSFFLIVEGRELRNGKKSKGRAYVAEGKKMMFGRDDFHICMQCIAGKEHLLHVIKTFNRKISWRNIQKLTSIRSKLQILKLWKRKVGKNIVKHFSISILLFSP